MTLTKNYEEKVTQLSHLQNEELIAAFNEEVGNTFWSNPRGLYLSALNEEIRKRKFKEDRLIIKNGRLSIKRKVKLIEDKIVSL